MSRHTDSAQDTGVRCKRGRPHWLRVVFCALLAALVISGSLCFAWLRGAFLPSWVEWNDVDVSADLDGDGADERLLVRGRRLVVADGDSSCETAWDWHVSDAFAIDVDRDGSLEIVMLVWKRGSYGPSKPFWVKNDEIGFSQHVFIYRYRAGELQPVWMSSKLGFDVAGCWLDGDAQLHLIEPDGRQSVWAWGTWGLELRDELGVSEGFGAGGAASGLPVDAAVAGGANGAVVTLLAVGDNIAHASIYGPAWDPDRQAYDFSPLYAQAAGFVSSYDIAVVNQETVLVGDPGLIGDYPQFGTPSSMGDALVGAGFDVVLAATNHVNDKGEAGIAETLSFWEGYPQVTLLGLHATQEEAREVKLVEKNGVNLALFNATYGLNGRVLQEGREYEVDTLDRIDEQLVLMARAEEVADLTVCFLHIGEEYADEPTEGQRMVVGRFIDAGADVVICSHAHIVQPYGRVTTVAGNSAIVYWGLGNFMSGQTAPGTTRGGAASLVIAKDGGGTRIADFDLIRTAFVDGVVRIPAE